MRQQHKFLLFSGASVIAHAAVAILLGSIIKNEQKITVSPLENSRPLQISMNAASKSLPPQKQINPDSRPKKQRHHLTPSSQQLTPTLEPAPESSPSIIDTASTKTTEVIHTAETIETNAVDTDILTVSMNLTLLDQPLLDNKSSEEKNAMIHEKLNALVRENFSYPGFAIKRGWQGTVKLGLRIEANGTLSNVRIIKTSGYSILDQAALSTLSKTDHINGIEHWLAGNYFDTTLPVKYQLIGG